jgi:transcription elongation factor Elf1
MVARFVCPGCGARNTVTAIVIQLAPSGDARCSHCKREGPARMFLPGPDEDPGHEDEP